MTRKEKAERGRKAKELNKTTSRQLAIINGDKFYWGKPCPKGHYLRYTSTGSCRVCVHYESMLLTREEYMRSYLTMRRKKFRAQGLTSKGTPRLRKLSAKFSLKE